MAQYQAYESLYRSMRRVIGFPPLPHIIVSSVLTYLFRYFKIKDGLESYRRPKDGGKLLLLAGLWDYVEYEGMPFSPSLHFFMFTLYRR